MSKQNFLITGKAYWTKVLGAPVPNYDENAKEWSIDVTLDGPTTDYIKRLGLTSKIKNKGDQDERGDFMTFKRPEINRFKNAPNKPIPVLAADGTDWPVDVAIGNGTKVQVKFGVFEVPTRGKFKGGPKAVIYEIKVLELVSYVKPPDTTGEQASKPDANQKESYSNG